MRGILAELLLVALTGAGLWLLFSLAVGLGVRIQRARIARIEAPLRVRMLSVLSAAPGVLAFSGVLSCLLPSVLVYCGLAEDHCEHHGGHLHLCVFHLPMHISGLGALLVTMGVGWCLLRWRRGLGAIASGRALQQEIARQPRAADGSVVLQTPAVFAAAVGLVRPIVVLSRGLLDALDATGVHAVLAHELAHVRRRDALRLSITRALWRPLPDLLGEPLLSEMALGCEEACDLEASTAVGDPLLVADAIVAATRAARRAPSANPMLACGMGFGALAIDRRVQRLIEPAAERPPRAYWGLGGIAICLLLVSDPLHHAVETVLGFLFS